MKFKFSGVSNGNWRIESENPEIFVEMYFFNPMRGNRFIFNVHGKRFGFQPVAEFGQNGSKKMPDDTWVHLFGKICCKIIGADVETKSEVEVTNTYEFENADEQELVLSLFSLALANFGDLSNTGEKITAKVQYSQKVQNEIARGNYLAGSKASPDMF